MFPSTAIDFALTIAALSPGYVYLAYSRRRTPRGDRTPFEEFAAFILGGALATGAAVVVVLALGQIAPFLLNLAQWADGGSAYLATRPWPTLLSGLVAYATSLGFARAGAAVHHRKRPPTVSDVPVWWTVFRGRGDDQVQCAVILDDGRVVEGQVDTYSTGHGAERDLALRPPLGWWEGGQFRAAKNLHRVVLSGSSIREIHVRYVDEEGRARTVN